MKQKQDSNTEQGHRANTLLYAVAPNPKLSTDAIALDGAVVSRGNGIGATSKREILSLKIKSISEDSLNKMTNEELDKLYFARFNRLAYHMSRQGYIHYLKP
jgi:hypothetical protein